MPDAVGIAGDVAAASAALAGLILVYIGAIAASFSTFQPAERRAVLTAHRRRVWFAVVGFVLFLIAVVLSILGKWLALSCMGVAAFVVMVVAMAWLLITAILTALEIK